MLYEHRLIFSDYLTISFSFATLTAPIMEGGIEMTYKQIEASREARLWLTQIVLPITAVIMMVPETRGAVMTKTKEMKKAIETKFKR